MRVHVVGLGMMGASLAGALSARGVAVGGSDHDDEPVSRLLERGWLSSGVTIESADLLVLAMPPTVIIDRLPHYIASTGAVVTDIASVKGAVLRACTSHRDRFVGGHPLCGNEGRGFRCADPTLFTDRTWFLVECEQSAPSSLALVREMLDLLGCRQVEISAEAHDRLLARVSHLPQLLSSALAITGERWGLERGHFGSGFEGMTRLSGSPARLWTEICRLNRGEILTALGEMQRELAELADNLKADTVEPWLLEAALARSRWSPDGEKD